VRIAGVIASVEAKPEFRAASDRVLEGIELRRPDPPHPGFEQPAPFRDDEVGGSELLAQFRDRGKTASVVLAEATVRELLA
jgi:hypothetical protein